MTLPRAQRKRPGQPVLVVERDIELLLQAKNVDTSDSNSTEGQILKILYASEDEKVSIGTDGSLTIVTNKSDVEMA